MTLKNRTQKNKTAVNFQNVICVFAFTLHIVWREINIDLTFTILIKAVCSTEPDTPFSLFSTASKMSAHNHVPVQIHLSSISGSANLNLLLYYTYTAWIDTAVTVALTHMFFLLCDHICLSASHPWYLAGFHWRFSSTIGTVGTMLRHRPAVSPDTDVQTQALVPVNMGNLQGF